jgi:hypothetical protein
MKLRKSESLHPYFITPRTRTKNKQNNANEENRGDIYNIETKKTKEKEKNNEKVKKLYKQAGSSRDDVIAQKAQPLRNTQSIRDIQPRIKKADRKNTIDKSNEERDQTSKQGSEDESRDDLSPVLKIKETDKAKGKRMHKQVGSSRDDFFAQKAQPLQNTQPIQNIQPRTEETHRQNANVTSNGQRDRTSKHGSEDDARDDLNVQESKSFQFIQPIQNIQPRAEETHRQDAIDTSNGQRDQTSKHGSEDDSRDDLNVQELKSFQFTQPIQNIQPRTKETHRQNASVTSNGQRDQTSEREIEDSLIYDLSPLLPKFAAEYLLRVMQLYSAYSRIEILGYELCMGKLCALLANVYLFESVLDVYVLRLRLYPQTDFFLLQPWEVMSFGEIRSEERKACIDRRHIIVPVCRNSHWILAVIDTEEQVIHVYDSLRLSHQQRHYRKSYLTPVFHRLQTKYSLDIAGWTIEIDEDYDQQQDFTSCGVFAMRKAKSIIRCEPLQPFGISLEERLKILWEIFFDLI